LATADGHSDKDSFRGWCFWPLLVPLSRSAGRHAAAALLILMVLFHLAAGDRFWSAPRNLVFDNYQQLIPRAVSRFPAVIIDIDERSLTAFGRWPWPRTRLAQLIEATYRLGALAVAIDIIMPEADDLSPNYLLAGRPELSRVLKETIASLPSNDAILAQTLSQVPSVIARAALLDNSKLSATVKQTPIIIIGDSPLPYLHSFPTELVNLPEVEAAATGRGYINDTRDADGVVRAMPLVIAVNGTPAPALALEVLRVATGEKQYSIRTDPSGVFAVQIGNSLIRTDIDGRLRLYFSPVYGARRVSAAAILKGEVKPDALVGQVAIIGATAVGVSDAVATPSSSRSDGVEIQAQLVENMLEGSRLQRPPAAAWWELLALLALALPLIFFLPQLRPIHMMMIFAGGAALLVIISLWLFKQQHFLLDPSFPAAGNMLVVLLLLFAGFVASERRRRELAAVLEEERSERLRVAGELRAAREIQMGMLPNPRSIEGLPGSLDFFALLEPAQEVGGDLYDGFMLDEDRLCFMIGDVSGKGVPASLFMALTKTLAKSLARREHLPLNELVRLVNDEASRENPAAMFVSAIIGVIDARSGEAELCNAGHNAPILLPWSGPPRELDGAGGPPLCIDEQFPYTMQKIQLEPGDILLLVTDGVTEAENQDQAQYGIMRVLDCFTKEPIADAAQACGKLHDDVKNFTAGAPPSDDLTILAIRFVRNDGKGVRN